MHAYLSGTLLKPELKLESSCRKFLKKSSKLCIAFKTLRPSVIENVVEPCILLTVTYPCNMACCSGEDVKNFKQIFKLQKMAIRLIANVSNATSCKPCFSEIRIVTLPIIYTLKFCAYKNVPDWVQNQLSDLYTQYK